MSTFVTEETYGPRTGTLISTGAFVATNVAVARTGWKQYRESELFSGGSSRMVDVYTSPEQLFSDLTMASAESKPVTLNHPWAFITPETWRTAAVGHMCNVRKGTEPLPDGNYALVADVVVNEVQAINAVRLAGIRGTSLGYQCEYGELGNGTLEQKNIVINHLALVAEPRTRNTRIEDAAMEYSESEIAAALNSLAGIRNGQLATEPRRTIDADASRKNEAALANSYADAANQAGAKMRGRDCRSNLRRSAEDAAPLPELSSKQKLEAWKRSEAYAEQCRKLHRQGNPLNVR
jgi:hypothetical protein